MKSLANSIEGRFLLIVMYYFSSSIMNDAFNLASFVIYLFFPHLKNVFNKEEMYTKKLWHQLTVELKQIIKLPVMQVIITKTYYLCVCS